MTEKEIIQQAIERQEKAYLKKLKKDSFEDSMLKHHLKMELNNEALSALSAADSMAFIMLNLSELDEIEYLEDKKDRRRVLSQENIILRNHLQKIKNNIFTY